MTSDYRPAARSELLMSRTASFGAASALRAITSMASQIFSIWFSSVASARSSRTFASVLMFSPVRSVPEGCSSGIAMIAREGADGVSPAVGAAGACRCAAPADSSHEKKMPGVGAPGETVRKSNV